MEANSLEKDIAAELCHELETTAFDDVEHVLAEMLASYRRELRVEFEQHLHANQTAAFEHGRQQGHEEGYLVGWGDGLRATKPAVQEPGWDGDGREVL